MPASSGSLDALISATIERHPHLKRRKVHFEAHQGRVVLRGVVNSYYQKQLAQEAVRRLQGVEQVENCLVVDWSHAASAVESAVPSP